MHLLSSSPRDGESMLSLGDLSLRHATVEITPKILAKIASLNSSIAFGDLRLGGCLRGPQNSRGFCGLFWHTRIRGLYCTSEFTVRALIRYII